MNLDELRMLESEYDTLSAKLDTLSGQHDADKDTFFEDEPWYDEYCLVEEQIARLTEQIDQNEETVMANHHREFLSPVTDGAPRPAGEFAWDHWEQWAKADGVSEELSSLGRAVVREAYQHNWPDQLRAECGWQDDGEAMIRLALDQPDRARIRWKYLLESDGDFHWSD